MTPGLVVAVAFNVLWAAALIWWAAPAAKDPQPVDSEKPDLTTSVVAPDDRHNSAAVGDLATCWAIWPDAPKHSPWERR